MPFWIIANPGQPNRQIEWPTRPADAIAGPFASPQAFNEGQEVSTMTGAASPAAFYGDPTLPGAPGMTGVVTLGAVPQPGPLVPLVIAFSAIVAMVGARVAGVVVGTLARILGVTVVRGTVTFAWAAWSRLPGWMRTLLITLGAIEGAPLLIDLGGEAVEAVGDIVDLIPGFDGDGGSGGTGVTVFAPPDVQASLTSTFPGRPIAKMWNTQPTMPSLGTWFVRFADSNGGAALRKDGTWRSFRYKKPVAVIYHDGATTLRKALAADRALNKQAKKIATMLRNRGYGVRRLPSGGARTQAQRHHADSSGAAGPVIVNVDAD